MAFSPTAIQYRSLAKPPRTPRTTAKKKTGRLRGWWNHGYAPKIMPDQLSALYSEFLEGGYDCVDRVVCNAYFPMGQSGGGFRMWWRELYGSDEDLDNNHLMRMAGRFSRRLRAWAEANGIPVEYCAPKVRKHEIAEEQLSAAKMKQGVVLSMVE